ncbi:hypothetical protein [Alkalihalobacillus sp. 1P02AB]
MSEELKRMTKEELVALLRKNIREETNDISKKDIIINNIEKELVTS